MTIIFKDRKVECDLDRNRDGSRFVVAAYWDTEPNEAEPLTDDEIDELQETCDDQINAMWG